MSKLIIKKEKNSYMCKVKDLKQGTFAIIDIYGEEKLVYIFGLSTTDIGYSSRTKHMVALDRNSSFWSNINNSEIPVVKILKSGTILEVKDNES